MRARFPLAGSTVVVTGAGSGIGRAFTVRLAQQGSPVAIVDHDEAMLEETASRIGSPLLHRALDVRDRSALCAFASEVAEWSPAPIGIVFNNAGVWLAQTAINGADEDDEWLHGTNYDGVVHGARAFLPALLTQRSGAIVNTSSVFGLMGIPKQTAYCASKFAVRGYTEALRQELRGTGVRAIVVHPGGIRTNIVAKGRAFADPADMGRDHATLALHHAADAMTTPERAAAVIQRGVEAGKARILVGPDAHLIDVGARISPAHSFAVLERLHAVRLRKISATRPH